MTISRRGFLGAGLPVLLGWPALTVRPAPLRSQLPEGRLRARPRRPTQVSLPGLRALGLSEGRDGLVFVPASYAADRPMPLVLALHGATGSAQGPMNLWRPMAEDKGLIVLSPDSRDRTWDVAMGNLAIPGGMGPDVEFIDRALGWVFDRFNVDARRLTIAGFSDGASYALTLGLINGDLFSKVVAFSPGFIRPAEWTGTPKFFVSHGREDPILPIDRAGRRIVVQLQRGGYSVRFREFDGGHEVPQDIRQQALDWLMAD